MAKGGLKEKTTEARKFRKVGENGVTCSRNCLVDTLGQPEAVNEMINLSGAEGFRKVCISIGSPLIGAGKEKMKSLTPVIRGRTCLVLEKNP